MKRFYFDVRLAGELFGDPDGSDLEDLAAARRHAIRIARGVISGDVLDGVLRLGSTIEVRDEARQPVLTLPFRNALKIDNKAGPEGARPGQAYRSAGGHLRLVLGSSSG